MRDDHERLMGIAEAIERIDRYAARGRQAFDTDELIQTWIVHHLQILGEAVRGTSLEFRGQHPEIPWSPIIAMRNILVHEYFGIDLEPVWSVIENDLPVLRDEIARPLADV